MTIVYGKTLRRQGLRPVPQAALLRPMGEGLITPLSKNPSLSALGLSVFELRSFGSTAPHPLSDYPPHTKLVLRLHIR